MKLRKTNNIIGNYVNWLFLLNVVTFLLVQRLPTVTKATITTDSSEKRGSYGFGYFGDTAYEPSGIDVSHSTFHENNDTVFSCPCDETRVTNFLPAYEDHKHDKYYYNYTNTPDEFTKLVDKMNPTQYSSISPLFKNSSIFTAKQTELPSVVLSSPSTYLKLSVRELSKDVLPTVSWNYYIPNSTHEKSLEMFAMNQSQLLPPSLLSLEENVSANGPTSISNMLLPENYVSPLLYTSSANASTTFLQLLLSSITPVPDAEFTFGENLSYTTYSLTELSDRNVLKEASIPSRYYSLKNPSLEENILSLSSTPTTNIQYHPYSLYSTKSESNQVPKQIDSVNDQNSSSAFIMESVDNFVNSIYSPSIEFIGYNVTSAPIVTPNNFTWINQEDFKANVISKSNLNHGSVLSPVAGITMACEQDPQADLTLKSNINLHPSTLLVLVENIHLNIALANASSHEANIPSTKESNLKLHINSGHEMNLQSTTSRTIQQEAFVLENNQFMLCNSNNTAPVKADNCQASATSVNLKNNKPSQNAANLEDYDTITTADHLKQCKTLESGFMKPVVDLFPNVIMKTAISYRFNIASSTEPSFNLDLLPDIVTRHNRSTLSENISTLQSNTPSENIGRQFTKSNVTVNNLNHDISVNNHLEQNSSTSVNLKLLLSSPANDLFYNMPSGTESSVHNTNTTSSNVIYDQHLINERAMRSTSTLVNTSSSESKSTESTVNFQFNLPSTASNILPELVMLRTLIFPRFRPIDKFTSNYIPNPNPTQNAMVTLGHVLETGIISVSETEGAITINSTKKTPVDMESSKKSEIYSEPADKPSSTLKFLSNFSPKFSILKPFFTLKEYNNYEYPDWKTFTPLTEKSRIATIPENDNEANNLTDFTPTISQGESVHEDKIVPRTNTARYQSSLLPETSKLMESIVNRKNNLKIKGNRKISNPTRRNESNRETVANGNAITAAIGHGVRGVHFCGGDSVDSSEVTTRSIKSEASNNLESTYGEILETTGRATVANINKDISDNKYELTAANYNEKTDDAIESSMRLDAGRGKLSMSSFKNELKRNERNRLRNRKWHGYRSNTMPRNLQNAKKRLHNYVQGVTVPKPIDLIEMSRINHPVRPSMYAGNSLGRIYNRWDDKKQLIRVSYAGTTNRRNIDETQGATHDTLCTVPSTSFTLLSNQNTTLYSLECPHEGRFPHPFDNKMYYICNKHPLYEHVFTPMLMFCPKEQIFDNEQQRCMEPEAQKSQTNCNFIINITVPVSTDGVSYNESISECTNSGALKTNFTLISNKYDSSTFGPDLLCLSHKNTCVNETKTTETCDVTSDTPAIVRYSFSGTPVCGTPSFECVSEGRFTDPTDPARYYICARNTKDKNGNAKFDYVLMSCPPSTVYDEHTELCIHYSLTTVCSKPKTSNVCPPKERATEYGIRQITTNRREINVSETTVTCPKSVAFDSLLTECMNNFTTKCTDPVTEYSQHTIEQNVEPNTTIQAYNCNSNYINSSLSKEHSAIKNTNNYNMLVTESSDDQSTEEESVIIHNPSAFWDYSQNHTYTNSSSNVGLHDEFMNDFGIHGGSNVSDTALDSTGARVSKSKSCNNCSLFHISYEKLPINNSVYQIKMSYLPGVKNIQHIPGR